MGASVLARVSPLRASASIRIATEYSQRSSAGKVLQNLAAALQDRAGIAVSLAFDQPDADALLRELREGRLALAWLGADTLRHLSARLVSCHTPGHFLETDALRSYCDRQTPTFRQQVDASGELRLLGHAELLHRRVLSIRPIRRPVDLQKWRVLVRPGDVMAEALRGRLGLTPVQAGLADWSALLAGGKADGALASAFEAQHWGLSPHLRYLNETPWSGAVGVMCASTGAVSTLGSESQRVLSQLAQKACSLLESAVSLADTRALSDMRNRLSLVRWSSRQKRIWHEHLEQVRQALPAAYQPVGTTAPAPPKRRTSGPRLGPGYRLPGVDLKSVAPR
ncbi:MAG: TRAP transporter substrate-binding protein DctP [Myxococcales bacterium]|nr:TRAP transporter substrate-binding protein DctP [Myxococcales bacterium]